MSEQLDRGRFLARPGTLWLLFGATVLITLAFPPVAGNWGLTLLDGVASPEQVRELIAGMTPEQRTAHAWITGTLDVAYPLAYASFFAGAALRFFPKAGGVLAIFALLAIPVDLFEGLVQILALTGRADWVATKSFITPLKMVLFLGGMAFTLLGLARWAYRRVVA